jgi:hypothetical protein
MDHGDSAQEEGKTTPRTVKRGKKWKEQFTGKNNRHSTLRATKFPVGRKNRVGTALPHYRDDTVPDARKIFGRSQRRLKVPFMTKKSSIVL